MTPQRWLVSFIVLASCSAPQPVVSRQVVTAPVATAPIAPSATPPTLPRRPITLIVPRLGKASAAAFSASSDAVVIRVGNASEPRGWSLTTGEPKPIAEIGPLSWSTAPAPQIVGKTSTTIDLDVQPIEAVNKAVKQLGLTVAVEGHTATVSTKRGEVGSDRSRFLWSIGDDGAVAVVRLDVGSIGHYKPWTTGMSGLGSRAGGAIDLEFGPDVERAIVSSSSQTGASYALADSRLVDTRTWRQIAVMPAGVQGDWYWSPSGAYVERIVFPSFDRAVSDGKTGKLFHVGEGGIPIGYSAGELLSVIAGEDGGGWVERTATGERVFRLPGTPEPPIVDLLFSPSGKLLLVVRKTRVDVWNLETGGVTLVDTHRNIDRAVIDPAFTFLAVADHVVRFDPPVLDDMSAKDKGIVDRPKPAIPRLPKLARTHETFEVESVVPRPNHDELLVVGCRGREVEIMGDRGIEGAGSALVIVDAKKKSVCTAWMFRTSVAARRGRSPKTASTSSAATRAGSRGSRRSSRAMPRSLSPLRSDRRSIVGCARSRPPERSATHRRACNPMVESEERFARSDPREICSRAKKARTWSSATPSAGARCGSRVSRPRSTEVVSSWPTTGVTKSSVT